MNNTAEPFNLEGKTFLIAEDELVNFKLLEVILVKLKAKILHAQNGKQTLEIFNQNETNIDLILLDIMMPEMDGYEVAKEIRKRNAAIPIIAQTAFTLNDEKEKAIVSGCNTYLTKPIKKIELLDAIKKHLK